MARQIWQDLYGIRTFITTDLSAAGVGADTASVFNTATADSTAFIPDHGDADHIGVALNKFGVPLLNHPTFDIGAMVINNRKATGTSYRQTGSGCLEYQQGSRIPTTTYEVDATTKLLALFCQLLFQGGASEESGSPYLKTFIPYASGDEGTVCAAALIRQMSLGDADSHMIGGAIVKTLTISGEEGQPIKLTAEFTGYNMVSDYDFNGNPASILEFDTTACLMFQNMSVKLAGTSVNIDKFDLTFSNNAVPKFYNTAHVTKYVLGDFTCTGSIRVPWAAATVGGNAQLNNFAAGTDCLLQMWWVSEDPVTTPGDGEVKIEVNARYTGATVEGEDEIVTTLPFEAAYDTALDANLAVRVYVSDSVDRKIA